MQFKWLPFSSLSDTPVYEPAVKGQANLSGAQNNEIGRALFQSQHPKVSLTNLIPLQPPKNRLITAATARNRLKQLVVEWTEITEWKRAVAGGRR